MTRAVTIAELGDQNTFTVDGTHNRVGIGSTQPAAKLDVDGTVVATSFQGDGSQITGVSGFATALSSTQTSPLFSVFKTSKTLSVGTGVSVSIESDENCGNTAFMRESIIHVGSGSTFHVGSGTTLVTNILSVFHN